MRRIRVLIADDHGLVRSGLRALLSAQPDIEVVGEAEDGTVVEDRCRETRPDVVLMDLTMPGRGGIPAAEDVRKAFPGMKILVLTMHDDEVYARQAARAGASGYVLKKALATELIDAVRTVHGGGRHVPPSLEKAFSDPLPAEPHRAAARRGPSLLSGRERDVLGLIALGHTNAEIGDRLHISEKTVETHRAHILEKLGLRTRADLVRFAIEHGLVRT
jgi:DNA-binding NarL/FixJ family response regulator